MELDFKKGEVIQARVEDSVLECKNLKLILLKIGQIRTHQTLSTVAIKNIENKRTLNKELIGNMKII